MRRLLVLLTVFYCLGIALAKLVWINFWWVTAAAAVIFIAAVFLVRKKYLFLVLAFFLTLFCGALNLKNSFILPKNHINNFIYYKDNSLCSLSGFVDSAPEVEDGYTCFTFRARQVQVGKLRSPCRGKVLVKLGFARPLSYGDNLILIGKLRRPYSYNSSSRSYKDYLARQGIYQLMRIKDPRQIIRQAGNSGLKIIRFSLWLRARMEEVIRSHLPDLPASILAAMVLGQKKGVPWLVNNSMVKSGTVHILVVSGFNVGIVAFILSLLFKICRIPRKARIILAATCLLIYCLITGSTNPVLRATVMGIVFLLAYLFKRDPDIYNSLSASALFILVVNPGQLFDIGFQLSFTSVLAIAYLYPKLKTFFHLENCKIKIWRLIGEGCLVSFSAWVGTAGIIAFNFHIIAFVTILANILIVPLATVITLCGFTLVLSGLIYPGLACFFSAPASLLINLLLNINAAVIRVPFAYFYL